MVSFAILTEALINSKEGSALHREEMDFFSLFFLTCILHITTGDNLCEEEKNSPSWSVTHECGNWEPLDDSQAAGVCSAEEVVRYEYHVLYSSSYQVPVLYFRACCLDGRPLTLDEIWGSVHASYQARLQEGPWDTITQQEHPILGQPFFVLHPCRTKEFISAVLSGSQEHHRHTNYIILWLSTVGPVVGLNLPLSYAKLAPEQSTNADLAERALS
uniref:Ubiquitin-like-conjugating enzyme ATG10 n=1 Tax=Ficedula albicollis TaxID=59894 RepID=A0A803VNR7_FICAL